MVYVYSNFPVNYQLMPIQPELQVPCNANQQVASSQLFPHEVLQSYGTAIPID